MIKEVKVRDGSTDGTKNKYIRITPEDPAMVPLLKKMFADQLRINGLKGDDGSTSRSIYIELEEVERRV